MEEIEGRQLGFQTSRLQYDSSLLTCLVDRWRPETHTFHFRWGEMAPTLQDVSYLLGLPLAGVPIGPVDPPANWAQEMAQRFFGIRDGALAFGHDNHGPKFGWLEQYQVCFIYLFYFVGEVSCTENCSICQCRYRGLGSRPLR